MYIERRQHERYRFNDDYTMLISTNATDWEIVRAYDISIGGVRFITDTILMVNEELCIKIVNTRKNDIDELIVGGYVVRIADEYGTPVYGVAFEPLIEEEYEQLNKVIGFEM